MRRRQAGIQATGILLAACLFRVDALDEIPGGMEALREEGAVKRYTSTFSATIDTDQAPARDDPEPGTSITVLSPNGGERFGPGDTVHIRWMADIDSVDDVMIWLLLDGGMRRVLITSQFSVRRSDDTWGDYPWVVPPDAVKDTVSLVTDQATIRLHQYRDTDLQDYSDEFFAIGNDVSVGRAGRHAEMSNTDAISIRRSRNHVSVTGLASAAGGTLRLVDVSGRVLGTAVVEGPAAAIETRSPVGPGMLLVRIRTPGGEMIEKCITH